MSLDSSDEYVISVAVPRPLHQLFTYRLPAELVSQVKIGGIVKVPFGRSVTHAFVTEPPRSASMLAPGLKLDLLKNVLSVGSEYHVLPDDVYALCKWASDYYFAPLGEVLNAAFSTGDVEEEAPASKRRKSREEMESEPSSLTQINLNDEQLAALQTLDDLRKSQPGGVSLLQGVTGSGKTEIYIELARRALAEGRGVLILVPEIALTPQLHQRFEQRLGTAVGLWHSAVAKGRRKNQVEALQKGTLRVVVGARSAVFAPIQKLGLIVVDEEHDPSYKQEERVRYHARDLAVVRAKLTGAQCVLGSATPSMETRERVQEGKYSIATLNRRIAPGGLPNIELVDLLEEELVGNTQAPLALRTLQTIEATLKAGEQVMIYLNRRGFAAFLLCKDCGDVRECPNCSISLTLHKRDSQLRCHVCAYQEKIPLICAGCEGANLHAMGAGTESLETELPGLLPDARILRLDRDQVTSTKRLNRILSDFREGKANVLLGTQMLVKGHDFPGVTLVVVMMADALFRWPDFRASERGYQILQQVSGRAGRGEKPGRVLVQTFDVSHPVLETLLGNFKEKDFLESERQMRMALGYPPFGRLVRLRLESPGRDEAILRAKRVAQILSDFKNNSNSNFEALGPSEAFMERVRGMYRWDILLKSRDIRVLQRVVSEVRSFCYREKWQIVADMDPYGV